MTKRAYWVKCSSCGAWLTDSGYDGMPAVRAAAQKHLRDTIYECGGGFDVEFPIYVKPDSEHTTPAQISAALMREVKRWREEIMQGKEGGAE